MATIKKSHYKVTATESSNHTNIFTRLWIMETKVNALAVELKRQGNQVELVSTGDDHQMVVSMRVFTEKQSLALEALVKDMGLSIRFIEATE